MGLWLCSAAVVCGIAAVATFSDWDFGLYFASLNPIVATTLAAVVGGASLRLLESKGWPIAVVEDDHRTTPVLVLALGTLLALPTVVVDAVAPFPVDMNLGMPWAVVFYPAIGYVAEVAFHLAPLALLIWLGPAAISNRSRPALWIWVAVACVEPAFQVVAGSSDSQPGWVPVFVAIHLFLFGLVQLWLYYRRGFVAAYAVRLIYYLHWHILWGALRLRLVV